MFQCMSSYNQVYLPDFLPDINILNKPAQDIDTVNRCSVNLFTNRVNDSNSS